MKARLLYALVLVAIFIAWAPPARAEIVLAPFVGNTFGAGAKDSFENDAHLVYGGTVTFAGAGLMGFEIDGQYSPKFFGGDAHSNVASLMGELTLGGGNERLRLYATAGGGFLKTRVQSKDQFFTTDRNSFGFTLGGSAIVGLGERLGVKGDLRYFRGLTNVTAKEPQEIDLSGFHFWRASAGLGLRF